jgi:hypothetical protein
MADPPLRYVLKSLCLLDSARCRRFVLAGMNSGWEILFMVGERILTNEHPHQEDGTSLGIRCATYGETPAAAASLR